MFNITPRESSILMAFAVMPFALFSQNIISGNVLDSDGIALSFANVLLLNASDSSLFSGNITDEEGTYFLENVPPKKYLISISMIGYETHYSTPFSITSESGSKTMDQIQMLEHSTELAEVQVVEKKALFEQKIDRMVVNVENSITSAGSNALEVLSRSPGVIVNPQSNSISMSGKDGVVVMINGKISRMPMDAVVEMLRGMSADNIGQIELIHTPPANFDAEGNAGFINIVMKKNIADGFNGGYTLSAGYGKKEKFGASVNFNYRKNNINLFGDYSWKFTNNPQLFKNYRKFEKDGTTFESVGIYHRDSTTSHVQNARIGMDIQMNNRTVIGGLVSWSDRNWRLDGLNTVSMLENGSIASRINVPNDEINHSYNFVGNVNLQHKLSAREDLNIDLDYAYFNNENPSNYTNQFYDGSDQLLEESNRRVFKNTPMRIWVGKIDYTKTFGESISLELGLKGTMTNFDNDVLVEDLNASEWIKAPLFSSEAMMNEDIIAGYSAATVKLSETTDVKVGLRYEYTETNLGTVDEPNIVDRKFGRLFPSLFLTKKLNEHNSLQFSYSRRINRPSFGQLAPWFVFFDPSTISTGNPTLQPAITDAIRGTYIWKTVQLGVQYSYIDQAIGRHNPSVDLETNMQINGAKNFISARVASATLSFPLQIKKWWEVRTNWTAQWSQVNDLTEGTKYSIDRSSWNMNGTSTFTLPKKYAIELTGRYFSPSLSGIVTRLEAYKLDFGIQKEFGNGGRLRFNVNDIFLSSNWLLRLDDPSVNFVYEGFYGFTERVFQLSYSHKFGNNKVKGARQRATGSAEEQRRAN